MLYLSEPLDVLMVRFLDSKPYRGSVCLVAVAADRQVLLDKVESGTTTNSKPAVVLQESHGVSAVGVLNLDPVRPPTRVEREPTPQQGWTRFAFGFVAGVCVMGAASYLMRK
jgi:hypothetical protein